jgi:UDP-glucose 4-epimerase
MKIVVTGGAGFIGSYLVDTLVANNAGEIWVVDNFYRGNKEYLQSHLQGGAIRLVQGDIRDEGILNCVFKKADLVYHLAGQSSVPDAISDLEYSFSSNVYGTLNVLSQAVKTGVKRIIFTSSREVYGEVKSLPVHENAQLVAKNPYGASKISAEAYCRAFAKKDLEVVILRLANVYGPRDTGRVIPLFTFSLLRQEPLIIYGETKVLDFIWVGDVVDILVQAGLHKKGIQKPVNIGSGVGTKLTILAQRLKALTGSKSKIGIAPSRDFEVTGYIANVGRMHSIFQNSVGDDPLHHLESVVQYWKGIDKRDGIDRQSFNLSKGKWSQPSKPISSPEVHKGL